MKEFSEIFKGFRKNKHMTQEQIAEVLGVSPQAVSRWETSVTFPDVTLLPTIAKYFETTVDELLGITVARRLQKVCFIQGMNQKTFNSINELLDTGWTVKEVQTHGIGEGSNIQGVAVLEKVVYEKED